MSQIEQAGKLDLVKQTEQIAQLEQIEPRTKSNKLRIGTSKASGKRRPIGTNINK